ncbi:hypothetical protein [Sphingobacterium sp. JUb56]|uniref:hypothetical protein n=1 Tax=Sphingobacterium sp. JUb56 TaxID=2587145 RepID=UPI00161B24D1|nr:hypothetical protein [Sphingobacterium sp. JUb56]MBB2951942.1 hypothetical protein [Sphingobacterium sp. JUb56]
MTKDDKLLKDFLNDHIDFYTLRKVGFFPKEMKKTDIHGQAERICKFFKYKTVYEYGAKVIHAHISYVDGHRPSWVNEQGEYEQAPFVEKFGGIYDD